MTSDHIRWTDVERVITRASDWLYEMLATATEDVLLTSPYLSFDICHKIAEAYQRAPGSWCLLTSLDPSSVANGYLSIQGLELLLDAGVEVRYVKDLHAKCFISGKRGMLGSANLTGAGLGSSASPNRELGVELSSAQVVDIRKVISTWPSAPVTQQHLVELSTNAKNLARVDKSQAYELYGQTALHLAEQLLTDARDNQRSLWIKLEYGKPALEGWRNESLFASPKKGKPSFSPGDLVFICAKDTQDCYAVVEVTSKPEFQPRDYLELAATWGDNATERWPWINRTKPRLVPSSLMELKLQELGISSRGLQNGHVRLKFDQFTAGVRALARLASEY